METMMARGQHADGFPAGFVDNVVQEASKLGLPHYILAAIVLVLSTLLPQVFGPGAGPAGPAGPPGKPAITQSIGVCIFYGANEAGKKGLHLLAPKSDGTCSRGWYLSLKPGN